jgi:hypothetical protein
MWPVSTGDWRLQVKEKRMNRSGIIIIAVVLVALLAGGGYLIFRNQGSGQAQNLTFNVNVQGDKMSPDKLSAHQDDTLTVKVTSDQEEEIHLHGYDLMFKPAPGRSESKTFKADKTGSFEIEIEDRSQHLGELEVLPR